MVGVAVPHVDEDAHVMVPVQEDERLLAEDDEGGVPELEQLGQGEQPGPEAAHFVCLHKAGVAD